MDFPDIPNLPNTAVETMSDRDYLKREIARRELARKSYKRYLYYVHGDTWRRTRMSDFLADEVQKFVESETGNAYDILLIETPPQHGKSLTVTESFPSWYLGKYPKNRVIEASYNDDTAKRFGRKNIEKVEQFGGGVFGLKPGSIWTTNEFELDNGWGRMISRGLLSGITGNPANLIIIDDPIKNREEADSQNTRDKIWAEWQNTLKSRLAAHGKVIVIMTPWHEDDFAARLLKHEPNVRLLRLPIEAEENDLLGRGVGDPLCPELGKDAAWLQQFKASYLSDPSKGGLRAWQALYQCSPRVEGGNLVRREWWKFYRKQDFNAFGTTVISVDATFKDMDTNDFVAIEVWSKLNGNYYLRYCLNRHLDFPKTLQAIRLVKHLFPETMYILIEDKANGSAIIQTLRSEFVGVIAVNPRGGKVSRVNSISPAIESGNVFIPEDELWAEEFIDQFSKFPAGEHDDMCFVAGTMIATPSGDRPIESLKPGDKVITPFGVDTVTAAGYTGTKPVVTRRGLTGTPDHPVFAYPDVFIPLESLTPGIHCSIMSLKEMITWKYRKLLSSMASHTDSWEVADIISASQRAMKADAMRKDFMLQCGSFIAGKQFLKAMKFITKTAIILTTTTATWSAYRVRNIAASRTTRPNEPRNILTRFARWLLSGTALKKAESGTESTEESAWKIARLKNTPASSAGKSSEQETPTPSSALTTVASSTTTTTSPIPNDAPALSAARSSRRKSAPGETAATPAVNPAEVSSFGSESVKLAPVYNLTVAKSHLYYAGGFLVHNCDAASQALNWMLFAHGGVAALSDENVVYEQRLIGREQEKFLSPSFYDPYGGTSPLGLPFG